MVLVYSSLYEIIVDFTRDYDLIKQALIHKIEHYDKTCLENMLQAVSNILLSNWGSQNYCQVIVFTDCGIGFGTTSLKNTIGNIKLAKTAKKDQSSIPLALTTSINDVVPPPASTASLPFPYSCKLSFICMGSTDDPYFQFAIKLYQELLDVGQQKGQLFVPKHSTDNDYNAKRENGKVEHLFDQQSFVETMSKMCETNYKQFDAILKCGGYMKLEAAITIWPPPLPYINKETETTKLISRKIEVCGFLSLTDIGSPTSVSRHLIMPKMDAVGDKSNVNFGRSEVPNELEKLENDIKVFYSKSDTADVIIQDDEGTTANALTDATRESVCVLLHGALKVENMAAVVLLNEDWYGFIYSYADSKKKSNLMLTVLTPGHEEIPWLGDLRFMGTAEDLLPGESASFPVKPEKRSYSQNCVVWIKQAGLQSDIQKVLRHAKKLPEKTQNFYKELNRIRRAALSLGFVELLEGLSSLFEREIALLPPNASPDCAMQLKHTSIELRKISNRDLKTLITAMPTKYNQL